MSGTVDWMAHAAFVAGPVHLVIGPGPLTTGVVSLAAATIIELYWLQKEAESSDA